MTIYLPQLTAAVTDTPLEVVASTGHLADMT